MTENLIFYGELIGRCRACAKANHIGLVFLMNKINLFGLSKIPLLRRIHFIP